MIRKLRAPDHPLVMELLQREPELNLFLIGDIENAGYEHPQVMHWGDFDRQGRLLAVLTRYFDSLVFYTRESCDLPGFLKLIGSLDCRFLCAESSILAPLAARLPFSRRRETILARLPAAAAPAPVLAVQASAPLHLPRRAAIADIPGIVMLRQKIKEFEATPDARMLQQVFTNKEGRAWVLEEAGAIAAVAQSAAESRELAMIVGVCTRADRRRRGFATACLVRLCQELRAAGKTPCLFYDNPEAGRLYRRLGFEEIASWSMLIQ